MLEEIKQEIRALGWQGNIFKPHKLTAFLASIKIIENSDSPDRKIYFNQQFKESFSDLFNDFAKDATTSCRPHTPFFHLKSSSFWSLVPNENKENELSAATTVGGPGALQVLVNHALLSQDLFQLLQNPDDRKELIQFITDCLKQGERTKTEQQHEFTRLTESGEAIYPCINPFVDYLNSLQRTGGGNENALAESQACNPNFSSIHVAHPVAELIHSELSNPEGRHIILTGHAGDGKSTLALEVYKRLRGIDADAPLEAPLKPREDLDSISIIKDLSERNKTQDEALISELVERHRRFLLVSNTGTLLDLVKQSPTQFGGASVTIESEVLDAISSETGEALLKLGEVEFRVFNLARMDNLGLARKIIEKMLAPERWAPCQECPQAATCPIHTNVELIQGSQSRVLERIFLVYRRMYEYGTRLTMRQFTEHLAYMITSGLDEDDIQTLQQQTPPPLVSEYLFFNRFFGDNGCTPHSSAYEMKAVQEIAAQGFGERPCPGWEHRLWLRSASQPVSLGIVRLDGEFEKMRQHGARAAQFEGMSPDQAREQVRRILYFLYDFSADAQDYLGQYLNSPTLLDWTKWQKSSAQLGFNEHATLERKIYHVLQEHFTGVRLPEGSTQNDRRLYVTLSRRRSEVRQSAQVVLAEVDWSSSTTLQLVEHENASGETRQDLELCGKERINGINLPLTVPFLDFVMMRHFGELGEVLEASYIERLDRFKAQVHEAAKAANEDRIMLVRLKTDHTFRRQHFAVNNNKLEVTDVL